MNSWWTGEALVLRVENDNLEIVCSMEDEIALSWNAIDLLAKPDWVADWSEPLDLAWRRDALPVLRSAIGKTVTGVSVVECLHEALVIFDKEHPERVGTVGGAWVLHGIELQFSSGRLEVFNGGDTNAVTDAPRTMEGFRFYEVA